VIDRRFLRGMSDHPFQLYCQRVDASKNMARYALSIQPALFGETALVRA